VGAAGTALPAPVAVLPEVLDREFDLVHRVRSALIKSAHLVHSPCTLDSIAALPARACMILELSVSPCRHQKGSRAPTEQALLPWNGLRPTVSLRRPFGRSPRTRAPGCTTAGCWAAAWLPPA